MQNDMRDRLIEIIEQSGMLEGKIRSGIVADELMANGVIVPPCKVGDDLFYIDRYSGKVEKDSVKFFTVTRNGVKPILTRHKTMFWDVYEWGKTVFLTKDQAEQKLKEMRVENG